MGWKDLSYWLRGLIVGIILYVLYLGFVIYWERVVSDCASQAANLCGVGIAFTLFFLWPSILICAFIGWIVGKIKSKK